MSCHSSPAIVLGLSLLTAVSLPATAALIELKSTQFTTFVASGLNVATLESRTNFSPVPISDSFTSSNEFKPLVAQADANLFRLFTFAEAMPYEVFRGRSAASASSEFTFSPATDASTLVRLEFFASGPYWGGNEVSLFDITTDTPMWSCYHLGLGNGTIPWVFDESRGGMTASLSLPTELLSSHDYKFRMSSWGGSSVPDFDTRLTEVFGLDAIQVVPEPSTFVLTALAGIALLHARRKICCRVP